MTRLAWIVALVGAACTAPDAGDDGRSGRRSNNPTDPTDPDGEDRDPDPSSPKKPGPSSTPPAVKDAGADSTAPVSKPAATRKIKDLTGPGTSSKQFGVGGTDLGIPVRQPNGKIAYIFGDSYEDDFVAGKGWRSPILLRSEPGNLDAGITFNGAAGGSYAKQLFNYQHTNNRLTWLPSDAITINTRMFLHFMVNDGLHNVVRTRIAYSDDNGENWHLSGAEWAGTENNSLRQLWTWERGNDGYVYVISTSFKRADPIILHRVPELKLLDKAAYEPWGYRDGKWAWGNAPTPVLEGKFGEMCLRRVENKWVLSWFNAGDYDLTIKVFDEPTSNLFTAKTYKPIKGGGWGGENDTTVAQLYGGYIHPDSTLHNLHLIISQWNTETNTGGLHPGWPYRSMQFITGIE